MMTRTLPQPSPLSWWCGIDRRRFHDEIAAREDQWRREGKTQADFVGARLREAWSYERRSVETRRTA